MKALTLMAALAASTLSGSATAQVILQPDQRMVDNFTNVARKALPMAVLPDGSNVPAETAEELAQPLVPAALDMQTVKRGMLAAEMTLCGLDWEQLSFRPYMDKLRSSNRYTDKQLAYIGVLHGFTMQVTGSSLAPYIHNCSKGTKRQLTKMADVQDMQLP